MAESVSLPEVLSDVRRRWKIATIVLVGVIVGAYFYGQSLPDEYTSTAIVSFAPKPSGTIGGDTLRVVLPKYVAFTTAGSTLSKAETAAGSNCWIDQVREDLNNKS